MTLGIKPSIRKSNISNSESLRRHGSFGPEAARTSTVRPPKTGYCGMVPPLTRSSRS
jgi:hypothetical protein